METRNYLFSFLINDLASDEKIYQKAAILKLYRMNHDDFFIFFKNHFKEKNSLLTDQIKKTILEIFKQKSAAMKSQTSTTENIEAMCNKTETDMINDWKTADVRIKLAILSQLHVHDGDYCEKIRTLALNDENPLVKLEAESLNLEENKLTKNEVRFEINRLIDENADPSLYNSKNIREMKILIVDDSKTVQSFLGSYISKYTVPDQVYNGFEAKNRIYSENYDLIFMDISLPDVNGLEILGEMRAKENSTPVIIMSTLMDSHIIQTAFSLDSSNYLVKDNLAELIKKGKLLDFLKIQY